MAVALATECVTSDLRGYVYYSLERVPVPKSGSIPYHTDQKLSRNLLDLRCLRLASSMPTLNRDDAGGGLGCVLRNKARNFPLTQTPQRSYCFPQRGP